MRNRCSIVCVFASFLVLSSLARQIQGTASEFFSNSLQYLNYTPLPSIPVDQQVRLASDVGLAALLGTNVYNFGELVQRTTTPTACVPLQMFMVQKRVFWTLTFIRSIRFSPPQVQHPIVKTLENTEFAWLAELLVAFNVGDIVKYQRVAEAAKKVGSYPHSSLGWSTHVLGATLFAIQGYVLHFARCGGPTEWVSLNDECFDFFCRRS